MSLTLVLLVLLVALAFEYINGFHDTANSIATVVATKVLKPGQAVLLAAFTNFLGAMWGTAVAKTISSGLIDAGIVNVTPELIICALLGATIWDLITWWWGLPSSSSHALIGGLVGAGVAKAGVAAIVWHGLTGPQHLRGDDGGDRIRRVVETVDVLERERDDQNGDDEAQTHGSLRSSSARWRR